MDRTNFLKAENKHDDKNQPIVTGDVPRVACSIPFFR